jgi:hypothetical protein
MHKRSFHVYYSLIHVFIALFWPFVVGSYDFDKSFKRQIYALYIQNTMLQADSCLLIKVINAMPQLRRACDPTLGRLLRNSLYVLRKSGMALSQQPARSRREPARITDPAPARRPRGSAARCSF